MVRKLFPQSQKTLSAVVILLSVVLSPQVSVSQSHWSQVTHFYVPSDPGIKDTVVDPSLRVYFINSEVGFVFGMNPLPEPSGSGPADFYEYVRQTRNPGTPPVFFKTTDGGKTWTTPKTTPMTGVLTSIYFESATHGYASTLGYTPSIAGSGVFETTDVGETWRQISPPGYSFMSVYATGQTIVATPGYWDSIPTNVYAFGIKGILLSTDGGAHWDWLSRAVSPPQSTQADATGNQDSAIMVGGVGPTLWVAA